MMCVVVGDAGGNLDHDDCGNSVDGGDACCCWCYQRQHSRNIFFLVSNDDGGSTQVYSRV